MKTTRKILPALVMLLVSAIMLSTASYAWFASNSQVKANNMHVKVKANTKFLEISTSDTDGFTSGVDLTNAIGDATAPGSTGEGWIELVHAKFGTETDPKTLQWWVGNSTAVDKVGDLQGQLAADVNLAKYVLQKTVYVRMSPNSDTTLDNFRLDTKAITVTATGTDNFKPALRVLAVAKDNGTAVGAQIYDVGEGTVATYNVTTGTGDAAAYLVPVVELAKVYTVDIYLYFDGTDAVSVTTNAGVNLADYAVSVGFIAGPDQV